MNNATLAKELEYYDQLHLLSLEHIREYISDQWDEYEATDEELVKITEHISENIFWFIQEAVNIALNPKK